MCGRFALIDDVHAVEETFGVPGIEAFPPRYNIAPTQPILLVTAGFGRAAGSNLPDRRALLVRWGLIPGWAKNPKDMPLLINARSESASEKPAFQAAMRHRRALVPASGFYEWKRDREGTGQPYWVRPRRGGVIAFAALMETFAEPGGAEIDTGAMLTAAATGRIAEIHHRTPIVIAPKDFDRWLDCKRQEPRDVADLMRAPDPDFFEAIPTSDKVNKVTNTSPDIQDEVPGILAAPKPERAQLSLF